MDRIALDLGFLQIYWYSIFIFFSILVGSVFAYLEIKRREIDINFFVNLIFYIVVFGIVGARLYYVAFNFDLYKGNPLEMLEIWNGGLAIHGGIFAGILVTIFYCKKHGQSVFEIFDILVVGLIIGQAIGRWGNFFNSEAYGSITTLETLKSQGIPEFIIQGMYINGAYRLPTFFYESIWNVFGFLAMVIIRRFYPYLKVGQLSAFYLIWYSAARFFIEGVRTDSLMFSSFKVAQIVSIGLFIIGVVLFIIKGLGSNFDNLYNSKRVIVDESNTL